MTTACESQSVTIGGVAYNTSGGPQTSWLGIESELSAERSDVVLSDLDGNWDQIYQRGPSAVSNYVAIPDAGTGAGWPQSSQTLTCSRYVRSQKTHADCFLIDDAEFIIFEQSSARLRIWVNPAPRRREVGLAERSANNPIARPDILVSRINPWHVGVAQDSRFLDSRGRPTIATAPTSGYVNHLYRRDPATERQLLIEYLGRNLAHRVGARKANGFRAAKLSTDLVTFPADLDRASPSFGSAVNFTNATAVDFVRFMKTPAVLKAISAHSNPGMSRLVSGYAQSQLAAETDGAYWYWATLGSVVFPTYDHDNTRDAVGFPLLRTLWQNGKLRDAGPCFYVHEGCQVNSVHNAATTPHSSSEYAGHGQLAENFLFYGNGLAILSRAKTFNDTPRGFAATLQRPDGCFGDTLREYARLDSADAQLAGDVAGYDRTYFWSILGDWTLRLDHTPTRDETVATFYAHANYGGQAISLPAGRYDVALLEHSLGNDVLSSLIVAPGFQVRLFQHHKFQSQGALIRGCAPSLGTMNDQVSSLVVEPIDQGGVRLFQHRSFQGPSVGLDAGAYDVNTLINTIGNDQLTSLTVQPGYEVRLYYHAHFQGGPLVLRGSISDLGSWSDIVSSLVVVRIQ